MSRADRSPLAAAALAAALVGACAEATGPVTFQQQFDVFWEAFDQQYPYFQYKHYDSGNPGPVTLGGGWSVMVPRTIIQTAQHRIIEWQGIPPDTVVPWRADLALTGRDTVIEFARSLVLCPACVAVP